MDLSQPRSRPDRIDEVAFDAVAIGERFERQSKELGDALAELSAEPSEQAMGRAALAVVRMQYSAREAELLSDRVRLMLARLEGADVERE